MKERRDVSLFYGVLHIQPCIAAERLHHGVENFPRLLRILGCRIVGSLGAQSLRRGHDEQAESGQQKSPHPLSTFPIHATSYPAKTAPPFTFKISPLMNPASGVHKKRTGPAISLALATRPIGIPEVIFIPTSGSLKVDADISVATQPGATQFTRIPRGANSLERLFVRLINAPLVTA